jgi:hypothetical protein
VNPAVVERTTDMVPLDPVPGIVLSVVQMEVTANVAEPTWPIPPGAPFREWERFGRYSNYIAAHIVAGRLEIEGVPTVVEEIGVFPGADCSAIWIPKELAHRARWILAWPPPTNSELTFLATGELLPDNDPE